MISERSISGTEWEDGSKRSGRGIFAIEMQNKRDKVGQGCRTIKVAKETLASCDKIREAKRHKAVEGA